jgi:hypothetical protein
MRHRAIPETRECDAFAAAAAAAWRKLIRERRTRVMRKLMPTDAEGETTNDKRGSTKN